MSNWNKVNSEMHSLTAGPYHCIVRESGQMHYCEVFRNDDLILVSTVEGLQEAKDTCEVEILADLQKRGVFNARIVEQPIFGKQSFPIVFDFKDTGNPEPFAVVAGYKLYTNSSQQKGVKEWSFSAVGISGEIISYRGFDTKEDAQHSALEWVHSHVFGKSATIEFNSDKEVERKRPQPNPTEVEETVIAQIRKRRDVGREKYGTTMEREDLSFIQWLQHLQEELLDAAIYAEKLKREHRKGLLSDMIADDENSGLYEA